MTATDDAPSPCQVLAQTLAATEVPEAALPVSLPCSALDLLLALHQEVLQTMLSDLAYAGRAGNATGVVAGRFSDDALVQAQAHWTQGTAVLYVPNYARALGHYDAALDWYERACRQLAPLTPSRDVRVVQVVRVFCLSELGRYREAQLAIDAAEAWLLENPNDYARLTLLLNRGQLAGRMGDYAQMITLADAMIALAQKLNIPAREAQGWINRAHAGIYLGRFAEAEAALGIGIRLATHAGERLTVARAQLNGARLKRAQGQLFAALGVFRDAEQALAPAPEEGAILALQEAGIYEQLRQLSDARRAARSAGELFARQMMPVYSTSAFLQAARIAIQQKSATAARDLIDLAIAQAQQAHGPQSDARIALAQAELASLPNRAISDSALRRRRSVAERAAQQAVAVLSTDGFVEEAGLGQLVIATLRIQLGDPSGALTLYRDLLEHFAPQVQLGATAGLGALLSPLEGLPFLRHATELAVAQRRALPMEELQARYSTETSPHHLRLAAGYLQIGDITRALESVCAAKAGPLLDLRAVAAARDSLKLAPLQSYKADLATWRQQADDQRRLAQHAAQSEQAEGFAYHSEQAEAAEAQVKVVERALIAAVRMFGDRNGQSDVPLAAELHAALFPDMALLEYVQIDDQLGCFLIRPGRAPEYRQLCAYRLLAPLFDRWSLVCRRMMDTPLDAQPHIAEVLAPLREILIAAWEAALATTTHLLIAPSGILHHMPWAMLFDGLPITVTLTPCGALWAAPSPAPEAAIGPARLLGYAGGGERHLPAVARELAAIASYLPGALVKDVATCADVQALPPPLLLHIAAHGLTNADAPLCSTIELADGPLLLLEAHRLNLHGTRLVVLSACETGVRPDYGDMALALAGAFLCAGARAVLASLWRVDDRATAALMERFYAALVSGAAPATALGQAQQHIRAEHPLDWAAFQLWAGACDIE